LTCCICRGLFGEQASLERVREELAGYSDHRLHRFAAAHPKRFGGFMLDAAALRDSGKCRLLARLLPQLKVLPPPQNTLLSHVSGLPPAVKCWLPCSMLASHATVLPPL
jgi:hypothetical protein